jgi:quercetin dioxygenase-like cupin family protein
MGGNRVKRLKYVGLVIVLGVFLASAYGTAQAQPEPPPVAVEVLTPRAVFTDDVALKVRNKVDGHGTQVVNAFDPSHIVTIKATVQPGGLIDWHTHPGPVFVTIAQGELTYVSADDCVSRRYPDETAFVDPGHGHVHAAYNSGDTVTVFYATFFEVPESGPITIPAEAPSNCAIPTA